MNHTLWHRAIQWVPLGFGILILLVMCCLWVVGFTEPLQWSEKSWIAGFSPDGRSFLVPPFGVLQSVYAVQRGGAHGELHFYVLGSDAGGRDLLALMARGSVRSASLVLLAVTSRMVFGVLAGIATAFGRLPVRLISLAAGRWITGFPYLVLAIIVIDALLPYQGRLPSFVVALALVGWRDVALLTSERIEGILGHDYILAAHALGTSRSRLLIRHILPHLRPIWLTEAALQASAVLVLLGELGFLGYFVGQSDVFNGVTLAPAEIGQLLSSARDYALRDQWTPVMVPAATLALAALAFEAVGGWSSRWHSLEGVRH